MRSRNGIISFAFFVCLQFAVLHNASGAPCTVPNQLANGQTADANQVMSNFSAVTGCIDAAPAGSTNAVQIKGTSGFVGVGPLTNGQLVIGSTGGAPQAAALTAGTGIAITNGPGAVTITATNGGGTSYDPVILAETSLLHYWPLSDAVGSTSALDVKGSANMTVVDSISNTAFGYAGIVNDGTTSLLMKGGSSKTDGLLTIPSGVIPASGDYSIELIFKHFGYFSPATTRLSMLLQMDSDNQIDLYIDATRFSPVNNVAGSYAGTIDSLNYSTGVAPNGKYHFVLVANSSNNTLVLYVNGVQLPTIYSGSIGRQSGAGWLGAFGAPRSSYSFPFMGAFQKIAIYGSALSPSAIATHFAATGF